MNRKELFSYLKLNEKHLIQEKTSGVKFSESYPVAPSIVSKVTPREVGTKAAGDTTNTELDSEEGTLLVKVVANTANWMDSYGDVVTSDAYSESVTKRGITIPHIIDHKYSVTSIIGDVQKVYTEEIALKELGVDLNGKTTALVFETNIRSDFNEQAFKMYANNKINQHSIGFRYQELRLAIDSKDPEDILYKEVWDKYYPDIINKEEADMEGYFWAVTKLDVLENSAVLFGANELTPTLITSGKSLDLKELKELPTQTALVEQGENTMTLDEALKRISDLETEVKQSSAIATTAERERAIGMLEAAKAFSQDTDTAIKAINKAKWDVEDATDFFTSLKAAKDASTGIDTSVVPFGKASEQAAGASSASTGLYVPKFATTGAK